MAGRKRTRVDGQVSREEYDMLQDQAEARGGDTSLPRGFPRADAATLSARRLVAVEAARSEKEALYRKAVRRLNQNITKFVREQLAEDPGADLSACVQDYLAYAASLHDLYLRRTGATLTWGNGDCGQLGHGEDLLEVKRPLVLKGLRDVSVTTIACGSLHNVVITDAGDLWSWGCNDDGALGRASVENEPGQVDFSGIVRGGERLTFIQAAAGDCQTVAMTTTGKVYAWGCFKDNNGKQWFLPKPGGGAGDCKRKQEKPMLVEGLGPASEVRCCVNAVLVLQKDRRVISFGIGESGELGRPVCQMRPDNGEVYDKEGILRYHLTPRPMCLARGKAVRGGSRNRSGTTDEYGRGPDYLNEASSVRFLGSGSYHSFVVMGKEAETFAAGLNQYGQLGLGENAKGEPVPLLTHVPALDGAAVVAVSGGMHSTAFLTADGRILTCGRSDSGQLGIPLDSKDDGEAGACRSLPVEVKLPGARGRATAIAAGANHVLALTSEREVYSWGFGDTWALGHGDDADLTVPKRLDMEKAKLSGLSGSATPLSLDAGAQHSAMIAEIRPKEHF